MATYPKLLGRFAAGFVVNAVISAVALAQLAEERMVTRNFRVSMHGLSVTAIQSLLKSAGVDLPADPLSARGENDAAMFLNERTGVLMVRMRVTDLDKIERAIAAISAPPPLVEVEAKYVEAPAHYVLRGVVVADKTTSVLTEKEYRDVVVQLEKSEGLDVLTPPRVTTISGRQARVSLEDTRTPIYLTPPPLPRDTRPDADPTPHNKGRLPFPADFRRGV